MSDAVSILLLVAAAIGAIGIVWQLVRKTRAKTRALVRDGVKVRDSIIGRPAVVDTITGRELAPPLPGVGQRLDTVERAVAMLADQHRVLDDHEVRIRSNSDRIEKLEAASVERVVNRQDSAQAWRAISSAIDATPDKTDD